MRCASSTTPTRRSGSPEVRTTDRCGAPSGPCDSLMQLLTTRDVMKLRACGEQSARDAIRDAAGGSPSTVPSGVRGRPSLGVLVEAYAAWAGVDVETVLAALGLAPSTG